MPRTYATASLNTPLLRPEVHDITRPDGAILRVYVYGPDSAPPIVLAHGWCENATYWNPQVNALAGQYRLIVPEHRGHGGSSTGTSLETIELLADDFAAVLARTIAPDERPVLVGHSLGGMTIMAWGPRHRQQAARTGAVLLANTGFGGLLTAFRFIPHFLPAPVTNALGARIMMLSLPLPPMWLLRLAVKWLVMPGGNRDAVDFCSRIFTAISPKVRSRWGRMLTDMDLGGPNPIPGVPTAVISSDRDYLTPIVLAERIADGLRAAGNFDRLTVIPGIGHETNVEAPEVFNAELLRLCVLAATTAADVA